MSKEEWLAIPKSNYLVSSLGKIRHKNKKNIRKLQIDRNGYNTVFIAINGKYKNVLVHRLVAQCFLNDFYQKPEVNHKDFNTLNNKVENLEMVTRKENMAHAKNSGRGGYLNSTGIEKLKYDDCKIMAIKTFIDSNYKNKEISKLFNVHRNFVSDIKNKKVRVF